MDLVVKPGETYKVQLMNDNRFEAQVGSVDENWVEFFRKSNDSNLTTIEVIPKARISYMQPIRSIVVWYYSESDNLSVKHKNMFCTTLSEAEIDMSRQNGCILFTDKDDAKEYLLNVKKEDNDDSIEYAVSTSPDSYLPEKL